MNARPHFSLLLGFAWTSIGPLAGAATRDEYRAASIAGLRDVISFGRAQGMVKKVLASAPDGKITIVGRGEIMLISQLLLAGREARDAQLLNLARDLVLACNKAALDGYDTPKLESLEQDRLLPARIGAGAAPAQGAEAFGMLAARTQC